MDTIYWVSLLVGGFFVILSMLGGGDTDADADLDFDTDADFDADFDFDTDADFDADFDTDADFDHDVHVGSHDMSPDFVDLFSIRALFLFTAFFGLTGVLLSLVGTGEPVTAILAGLTGAIVGLGGNYIIKSIGYKHISSNVSAIDLKGKTGQVILPFDGTDQGKITLVSKGQRLQLVARSFAEADETFQSGDEVVVVRVDGRIAEVVKPQ